MATLVKRGIICPIDDGYDVNLPDGDTTLHSTGVYIDGTRREVSLHHAGDAHEAPRFSFPGDPDLLEDIAEGLQLAAQLIRDGKGYVGS